MDAVYVRAGKAVKLDRMLASADSDLQFTNAMLRVITPPGHHEDIAFAGRNSLWNFRVDANL